MAFRFLQRLSAFCNGFLIFLKGFPIFLNGFPLSEKSEKIYLRREVYERSLFELGIFFHSLSNLLSELRNTRYNTQQVASNDDGAGNGGRSDGNGDKGAGRATTRAMAAATNVAGMRVASNKEDKGAGRATTRAMSAAMTVAAMRVASDKEGDGGKAMETVTRLASEQRRRR
jgi:hypothetical protein